MVTGRKNISEKAPIVGSQFKVYDLNRIICGSIPFKSMMINFRQPKSSSSHVCIALCVYILIKIKIQTCYAIILYFT